MGQTDESGAHKIVLSLFGDLCSSCRLRWLQNPQAFFIMRLFFSYDQGFDFLQ